MSAAEHLAEAIAIGCTRDDHDHIGDHRREVLAKVADMILAARVRNPLDEAEEHVNDVLTGLAADVRRMGGGR